MRLVASAVLSLGVFAFLAFAVPPAQAVASTFAVTTTADSGAGSLRAAVEAANSNANPADQDIIVFNIAGTGTQTIALESPLAITQPVIIDGLTQGDSGGEGAAATCTPRALRIAVVAANSLVTGIEVNTLANAGVTLRGLAIGGFADQGVWFVSGSGHRIECSNIGADVTGSVAVANENGVVVQSNGARIGGGGTAGNVVSGNLGAGVIIADGNGTSVQGNVIGLNAAGTAALPNEGNGIEVTNGTMTLIGGSGAGLGNVISGNDDPTPPESDILPQHGIALFGSTDTHIAGNIIGLDATGTTVIANDGAGVFAAGDLRPVAGLVVGGTAAEGNVISGNALDGISLGVGTDGATITANRIGLIASGTAVAGNGFTGVAISSSSGHDIGLVGGGNVIGGNGSQGILIVGDGVTGGPANDNRVRANIIGYLADGTTQAPNAGHGVFIIGSESASGNSIGGVLPGEGNRIFAVTDGDGVAHAGVVVLELPGGEVVRNTIRGNAIVTDTAGIDLTEDVIPGPSMVTPNDAGDADSGPNNYQNFPILESVVASAPAVVKFGFDSTPGQTFTIDFYRNPVCIEANRTGAEYLGSVNVVAGAGETLHEVSLAATIEAGHVITATATDAAGNTSEFGNCVIATAPAAALELLSVVPGERVAGSGAFTLTANGAGFEPGMSVRWNGLDLGTVFVSSTVLQAEVPAELSAAIGVANVEVAPSGVSGGPSGPFVSNALPFVVLRSSSDVDCDGQVTVADVQVALQLLAGFAPGTGACTADADKDGSTNIGDSLWIRREIAGLVTPKPSNHQ